MATWSARSAHVPRGADISFSLMLLQVPWAPQPLKWWCEGPEMLPGNLLTLHFPEDGQIYSEHLNSVSSWDTLRAKLLDLNPCWLVLPGVHKPLKVNLGLFPSPIPRESSIKLRWWG